MRIRKRYETPLGAESVFNMRGGTFIRPGFSGVLGRRVPRSITPDRCDRAECAAELRLMSEIIGGGWVVHGEAPN